MEQERVAQLESILDKITVGVVILNASNLHVLYANPYIYSLLNEPCNALHLQGQSLSTLLPHNVYQHIYPILEQVTASGERFQQSELPYEGFLEARGRTYWRVSVERRASHHQKDAQAQYTLLITIEDVTETVRSHLHLNAIHAISSAIAGPTSLPSVLDRILQVLQELFGSKRCAILLIDQSGAPLDPRTFASEEPLPPPVEMARAIIAAQQGIHLRSQDWHPQVDTHILLGRAIQEGHTLIVTDTSTTPELDFPFLAYQESFCRPGSVLCVPIFEPHPASRQRSKSLGSTTDPSKTTHSDTILGCIEVYHRQARGFPAEEVTLLERFAQQAGLAIQNARLFHSIDRWARAASRQARQKENVMQAIPDGVVIYDPRWRVADANQAARQLLGWSDDVIGLPISKALERSNAIFKHALPQPDKLIAELEHRALTRQIDEFRIDGSTAKPSSTIHCSYTPIRDELGDIFAFIVIYHDVTEEVAARDRIEAEVVARTAELKQRNQALQQARAIQQLTSARMSLLLERLPSGVILVSANHSTITVINQHAIHLLQHAGACLDPAEDSIQAAQQAIGTNCEDLLRSIKFYATTGSPIPYEEQPLYTALVQGQACEAELHTTKKDGQVIYLLINAAPLRAADDTVNSAILVLQEITRIKHLEQSREDFFTTMAHELKTPLANIRAHLSALLAKDLAWSNEEQYDFLQTADQQVDRLVGMINHFLDASRVEAGALHLELEPLLIPELLEDLQDRLVALITPSGRQLHILIPPQLPAVIGDYELIISVLSNLLSNAFRYAPEGDTVQLLIEPIISAPQKQPTDVKFSVTDRGPGITLEQQQVLFTRFSTFAAMSRPSGALPGQPTFERPPRSTRWSPATGLGLYISRGIIEAHHSKLLLTSSPGQGATFAFTLPIFRQKRGQSSKDFLHP